jgi:hypothetical protein
MKFKYFYQVSKFIDLMHYKNNDHYYYFSLPTIETFQNRLVTKLFIFNVFIFFAKTFSKKKLVVGNMLGCGDGNPTLHQLTINTLESIRATMKEHPLSNHLDGWWLDRKLFFHWAPIPQLPNMVKTFLVVFLILKNKPFILYLTTFRHLHLLTYSHLHNVVIER